MASNFFRPLLVILDPRRVLKASCSCSVLDPSHWVIPEGLLPPSKASQTSLHLLAMVLCCGRGSYHTFGEEAEIQEGWTVWRKGEGKTERSPF